MQKYWRPGLRVWWRGEHEAQIGVDPPHILFGLTQRDHRLLDALAYGDPQLDCWTIARSQGWKLEEFDLFLTRLPDHALVDTPSVDPDPSTKYWSVVDPSGSPAKTNRGGATVIIDGLDPLGWLVTDLACSAGLARVGVRDDHPVTSSDLQLGCYHADDIGHTRGDRALTGLRKRHPRVVIHPAYRQALPPHQPAPDQPESASHVFNPTLRHPSTSPHTPLQADLAVVISHGALPLYRVRPYANSEVPILPVVVRDIDVMIGPKLGSPGPCLRCLHLTFTDEDDRWPVLATQLASCANTAIDPVVTHVAAAVITHQLIAITDRRPNAVECLSLHVDGIHPIPRHQEWKPHPRCGCQLSHLAA